MVKILLAGVIVAAVVLTAAAGDLGSRPPAKSGAAPPIPPPPDPAALRQGGDTVADAVRIPIPTLDLAGTTDGYTNDYDVQCPYGSSLSPDVVYSIVPEIDLVLDIDLCGSSFDTRIWVWDETLGWPLHCNDDWYHDDECGHYTSKIENVAVAAGEEYFIVIDGFGGDHGDYIMDVVPSLQCQADCAAGAALEGEPPLVGGYFDLFNGGCYTNYDHPVVQTLTAPLFCGVSGWYETDDDVYRDTDWFEVAIPAGGVFEITLAAECDMHLAHLGPRNCMDVEMIQDVTSVDCDEPTISVVGDPGELIWIWVAPAGYGPWYVPSGGVSFDYVLVTNLAPVAVEAHSWTEVKALFR